jgi:hypothetical protein
VVGLCGANRSFYDDLYQSQRILEHQILAQTGSCQVRPQRKTVPDVYRYLEEVKERQGERKWRIL